MKLCECGCGDPAPIARENDASKGWVKGQPVRFRRGHCFKTHGHSVLGSRGYRTYKSWCDMKRRCLAPEHAAYARYGAAGVKVAPEWMTFEGFIASLGERPEGKYSLGRILDMGDYTEGNAFWQTQAEQSLARRNRTALRKYISQRP